LSSRDVGREKHYLRTAGLKQAACGRDARSEGMGKVTASRLRIRTILLAPPTAKRQNER